MQVTPLMGMSDLKKLRMLPGVVVIIRPWMITGGFGVDIVYDDQETLRCRVWWRSGSIQGREAMNTTPSAMTTENPAHIV